MSASTVPGSISPSERSKRYRRAAPTWVSAHHSSSMAAWASYVATWRRPSRELTASKSLPMLEVGTQLTPRSSWRRSAERSTSEAAATGGSDVGPVDPRRPQVGQGGAVGLADGGVTAGQGDRAQVRGAHEGVVAGDEDLAAPDGPVLSVSRAVEGETDDALAGRDAVLDHGGGDVGVVMVHQPDRESRVVGPATGLVAGVGVGRHLRGVDAGTGRRTAGRSARRRPASRGCPCRRCAGS